MYFNVNFFFIKTFYITNYYTKSKEKLHKMDPIGKSFTKNGPNLI